MVLIGCDFHPSWQQVSWVDRETGEAGDEKLVHAPGAVEKFYRQFPTGSRIGMEATGNCQWFVELLHRLGHELWVGDAAKIRASDDRQQKAWNHFLEHFSALAEAFDITLGELHADTF